MNTTQIEELRRQALRRLEGADRELYTASYTIAHMPTEVLETDVQLRACAANLRHLAVGLLRLADEFWIDEKEVQA